MRYGIILSGTQNARKVAREWSWICPPNEMPILDTLSDVSTDASDDESRATELISLKPILQTEKNRTRKRRHNKRTESCPFGNPSLRKYWDRRYELFERFDQGIQIDEESWYSVTPESIARYQASIFVCDVVMDIFAGVGGNTIQFALTCGLVLAIENNYSRLSMLMHNAQVYGVAHKIIPIYGDAIVVMRSIRSSSAHCANGSLVTEASLVGDDNNVPTAYFPVENVSVTESTVRSTGSTVVDMVFISPPWGGPGYTGLVFPPGSSSWNKRKRNRWLRSADASVEPTKNLDQLSLLSPAVRAACHLSTRSLVYLPRNSSVGQILRLGWPSDSCDCTLCSRPRNVTLEDYLIRGRRIAVGAVITVD